MSRTYSNTPVLSKIKIGETVYWLKDADARALLDSIDGDIWAELLVGFGTIGTAGDEDKLVKASDIKQYVDAVAEASLEIVALAELPAANAENWEIYHNSIVLVPKASAQSQNAKDEYIIMRTGTQGAYEYAWEKIGDTAIDLSGYVTDVKYVAASHKLQQQKNGTYTDVHQFGSFADVSQGQATLNDYVTGVASATVVAAGTISGGLVKDAANGVQISGTISKPGVGTTLSYGTINIIDSVGVLPSKQADSFTAASLASGFYKAGSAASFVEGSFTAASLTTETKALYKQGIVATVGSGTLAEMLIISDVEKEADIKVVASFSGGSKAADTFVANAPAEIDVSKFSGGSFVEGAFNAGSLPTTKAQSVVSGVSAALEAAPAFTGDKFAFEGSFTGSTVNANVSLSTGVKTITVDPKAA